MQKKKKRSKRSERNAEGDREEGKEIKMQMMTTVSVG